MNFRHIIERIMGAGPMTQHAATATVVGAAAGLFLLTVLVPKFDPAAAPDASPVALLLLPLARSI